VIAEAMYSSRKPDSADEPQTTPRVMGRKSGPRTRRHIALAGALCAAALLASGCSSSSTHATANVSGSKSAYSVTSAGSSNATSDCVSRARAKVAAQLGPINQPFPTNPSDASVLRGKTVWLIEYSGSNPILLTLAKGVEQAALVIGASVKTYDGKSTPSGYNAGIQTAVSQGAGGIVIENIDPSLVPGALNEAAAAHIPVIDSFGPAPDAPYPLGLVGHMTSDPAAIASAQVDYALAHNGCKGRILYAAIQGLEVEDRLVAAAQAEVKALCPQSCSFQSVASSGAKLQTDLPQQVESAIQRNSSISYVVAGSDSLVPLIAAALKTAGHTTTHVVGLNGSNVAAMKSGQMPYENADVGYIPNEAQGWFMVNALIEAAHGQKNSISYSPHTYDASNLDESTRPPEFEKKFARLWGITTP
jgi:ribose transport system substrate-binding protein